MDSTKNLIPIIILLIFSFYSYQEYSQLPQTVINGIVFLPGLLATLALVLSVHFNRNPIFFYSILVITANLSLGQVWVNSDFAYALLSIVLPLLLVVITVLPDRGVFSVNAAPVYGVLTAALVFSLLITNFSPEWISYLLLSEWFPARYFDWTQQSQSVLIISTLMFITMIVLYFLKPSNHMATGLGVLIMLTIQLHFRGTDSSLTVFSSIALMMCLYTVLKESWRMAYLDELTELPARRAMSEKFQQISGIYTIAMLDIDHFKTFNDTYGHDTGDAVLRMIANKMRNVSGEGTAYRYGGEEFAIIFNGKTKQEAKPHLEALRELIANTPFIINRASRRRSDKKVNPSKAKTVMVTVSIGIANSTSSTPSPWDVLKLADKALYRAKDYGRNCIYN